MVLVSLTRTLTWFCYVEFFYSGIYYHEIIALYTYSITESFTHNKDLVCLVKVGFPSNHFINEWHDSFMKFSDLFQLQFNFTGISLF